MQDQLMGEMIQPGVVPKLSRTPGRVSGGAPLLGEHNEEIYLGLLALDREQYKMFCAEGVI